MLDMKLDMKLDTPGLATDIHRRYGYITEFGKEWGGGGTGFRSCKQREGGLNFFFIP